MAAPVGAAAPVQSGAIHQFRRTGCSDWYDGHPDNDDGRGPYEARTLYASPQSPVRELTDERVDAIWNSLPGIAIHNDAAKRGLDTNYVVRIAFARAVLAAAKGGNP